MCKKDREEFDAKSVKIDEQEFKKAINAFKAADQARINRVLEKHSPPEGHKWGM